MNAWSNSWRRAGGAIWIIALLTLLAWLIWRFGERVGLVENHHKLLAFLLIICVAAVGYVLPQLLAYLKQQSHREKGRADNVYAPSEPQIRLPQQLAFDFSALRNHLRDQYGFFWRHKVRLILVIGEPLQIQAIAPALADQLGMEGQSTVLLWGGTLDQSSSQQWAGLSRWRALDGVVWALSKAQLADDTLMSAGVRQLQRLARRLRWHLPLHLWQVDDTPWPQSTRDSQAVGCLLPPCLTLEVLENSLKSLLQPLRHLGLSNIHADLNHDFLLRLSRDLHSEGITRWRQTLAPLLGRRPHGTPLRGLWFSPPIQPVENCPKHIWPVPPAWQGIVNDKPAPRRLGWSAPRIAYTLALSMTLLWTAGLLLSFSQNRTQISRVQTVLHALQTTPQGDAQLLALNELVDELARLDYRAVHGTPWYQRFGLNQNQSLLATLWPHYVEANNRLIRDPAAAILHQQLSALLKLAPDNPQRTAGAYAQLKAYLMMARPEKADAALLLKTLNELEPARAGIPPQSPLIALMNTLAYQGQAGARTPALADSLVKSAQKLIGQDKAPLIDQLADVPGSPLDTTFGPLLALLDKRNDDGLSLQTFLTRVTRVRLTLQQVSTAPDPLEMTQTLAQSVFQGRSIDLTDTQSYGSLLAASLGAEWGGVAQTLFVQPLEHAWQRVLQPSAAGLNSQWQRSIVNHWDSAFASRYPFAASASDASLPMLGQMIRADSGRIERFLQQQLSGVLRKEGNRWLADPRHSQGLRFNPQFLSAINQLSNLADVLYTDGGMGLRFELQGKPVRDVVQTRFILDGERHDYFNQKESWQRFNWPGRSDYPGASLSWTSVHSGERLFGDFPGTWGLLRLLEKAQVTPLDDADSRYRVVLKAPDGLNLVWYLRTELEAGPLALLKLRGFKLPRQIFLSERGIDTPYAQNGSLP